MKQPHDCAAPCCVELQRLSAEKIEFSRFEPQHTLRLKRSGGGKFGGMDSRDRLLEMHSDGLSFWIESERLAL